MKNNLEQNFVTDLSEYTFKETEDGSCTLFSSLFQEACHSYQGAKNETDTYYLKGCQILERAQHPISILEIGFGIGLGFERTFEVLKNCQLDKNLNFLSFELDEELVIWVKKNSPICQDLVRVEANHLLLYTNSILTVVIGDARKTLPLYHQQFPSYRANAIYHDAFSPSSCPKLWTQEWFSDLKKIAADDCIFSTYSISSKMRKSLLHAGWSIFAGADFGRKKGSTIAKIQGASDPALLEHLEKSPVMALQDSQLEKTKPS